MLSAGAGDNSADGRQDRLLAYGDQGAGATAARPRFDIWASGYLSRFKDDTGNGGQAGNFALLFTGADYIVGNLAIGVMAQIDRVKESSGTLGTKASGTGWMVGPYAVAQVHRNLFVQARAAWGRSDNDFTVVGASTGNYDGERWLLSSQIEGRWYAGRWRFSPIATIVYFEEKQEAFVNSLSQAIPGQSVALGRLTFGPEIGYNFVTSAGTIFEPHVALSGVWDFKETAQVVNGQTFSPDELSANLAAGVIVRTRGGTALRSILTYEGIGDGDFEAISGTVLITVPF
jgi:outer membrane autotransporter protein